MSRYFLHLTDGTHWFSDDTGRELSGLRAARAHAIRHTRELKAAVCDPHIQDLSGWMLTVVDASGHPLFALGFDFTPRLLPAVFLAADRCGAGAPAQREMAPIQSISAVSGGMMPHQERQG